MTEKVFAVLTILMLLGGAAYASSNAEEGKAKAEEGKTLYSSAKFKCFQCHGKTGVEGGMGPSFEGVGKKYDRDQLMERAAHNCPPTGTCDPKQLGAIVDYLRTL